jgi:hypothetical protein
MYRLKVPVTATQRSGAGERGHRAGRAGGRGGSGSGLDGLAGEAGLRGRGAWADGGGAATPGVGHQHHDAAALQVGGSVRGGRACSVVCVCQACQPDGACAGGPVSCPLRRVWRAGFGPTLEGRVWADSRVGFGPTLEGRVWADSRVGFGPTLEGRVWADSAKARSKLR